jgi:hypothetical protein
MIWAKYFDSLFYAHASDEYRRWQRKLMLDAYPVLKELSWQPCLFVVDGRPYRYGARVCGGASRGE